MLHEINPKPLSDQKGNLLMSRPPRDIHLHFGGNDDARFDENEPEQPVVPQDPGLTAQPPEGVRVTRAQTSRYHGPFAQEMISAGLTITEIRRHVWAKFKLAEGLVAVCNGEPVEDSYVTRDGDWIHFNAAPKELGGV